VIITSTPGHTGTKSRNSPAWHPNIRHETFVLKGDLCFLLKAAYHTLCISWRDSISWPIAPVSSVAGGDDTTRPSRQGRWTFVWHLRSSLWVQGSFDIHRYIHMYLGIERYTLHTDYICTYAYRSLVIEIREKLLSAKPRKLGFARHEKKPYSKALFAKRVLNEWQHVKIMQIKVLDHLRQQKE
jgi:hypothetical protein